MRIVVAGATGNVGTSLLTALQEEPRVDSVLGVVRRPPQREEAKRAWSKTSWAAADITRDDLLPLFRGADAVVHLAWLIQPSHDQLTTWRVNVEGSKRVLAALVAAGVPALVYASSVGAYAPGPKDRLVNESWPTDGVPTSSYSRDKAYVERLLDVFERDNPAVRVVRLRPALIFKREAASEIRRLFIGPLLPGAAVRHRLLPVVPSSDRLRLQAVHSLDAAEAYRLALLSDTRGPFNLAADPVLDASRLAELLRARPVRVPIGLLRAGAAATWQLRLQPASAGWLDLAAHVPLLDSSRAGRELGWTPRHSGLDAVRELLAGIGEGDSADTPPLARTTLLPS